MKAHQTLPGRGEVSWDSYRVAYQVAQSGSLSQAARELATSHATVLRDVNKLEAALNLTLFIRHQRGYQLTDAGRVLIEAMPEIQAQFAKLNVQMETASEAMAGRLRISCLAGHMDMLMPALKLLRERYPKLMLQLMSTEEIISPASGLVHVSLRSGRAPTEADLITRQVHGVKMGLYVSEEYVARKGLPESPEEFAQHEWLLPASSKHHIPFVRAIIDQVPPEQIVLQSNTFTDLMKGLIAGLGIGLMSHAEAKKHSVVPLKQQIPDEFNQDAIWFLYHRDLKSSAKIKALYECLMETLEPKFGSL